MSTKEEEGASDSKVESSSSILSDNNVETKTQKSVKKKKYVPVGTTIEAGGTFHFLPDKNEGYVPAQLLEDWSIEKLKALASSTKGKEASTTQKFLINGTDKVEVPKTMNLGQRLTRFNVSPADDLVSMQETAESFVLNNLACRYHKKESYTRCGPQNLVYVHDPSGKPGDSISKSREDLCKTPFNFSQYEPDICAVAHRVYEACIEKPKGFEKTEDLDYSIVVSGSKGAGSSDVGSRALRYLFEIGTSSSNTDVIEKLDLAEHLIRTFAYTNETNLQFTRVTSVKLNASGLVGGAKVESFGLRHERVTHCPRGLRNFEIFYDLFQAPMPRRRRIAAMDTRKFNYLRNTDLNRRDSDVPHFRKTLDALTKLVGDDDMVFTAVAAVLHIGNVNFVFNETIGAKVIPSDSVTIAADLLAVDVEALKQCLCADAEDVNGAIANRDALARHIYACLFDFVLEKINESLSFDSPYPLIRVVESPGFAVTGVNRWSDFVSSYFAENIYRYYVHSMFVAEQEFLAKNLYGSDYVLPVKFRSNDETMDFMNHVISFFKSNASKTSSASALGCAKFLDYCKAKNSTAFGSFEDCLESKNEELKSMDLVAHEPSEFVIRHMSVLENASADTIYDATNILSEIDTCLSSTAKSLFAESAIGKVFENNTGTTEDLVKSAQNFTHILETSTPHFVHCLLSSIGDDEDFHGGCVLRQIRSIQLAQLAKSIKKGMPYKRSHKEFLSRYYSLAARNVFANVDLPALDPEDENTMLYSKRLQVALSKSPLMRNFKQSKLVKKGVTGGLGFVFFNKQSTHKTLERFRNKEINASVDILVRSLKTMLFRSKIKNYITMITSLKRAIKDRSLSDLNSLVIKARPMVERLVPLTWTLQAHFKNTLIRAESCIEHLNKQNDVEKRLDEILTMDPYENNDLYKEVLSTCKDLRFEMDKVRAARSKFTVAQDRIQAEKMMEEGLTNYDGTKINNAWALSMKETVKSVYGDIFVVTDRYNEVSAKIKEETQYFGELHKTIVETSIRGSAGNLNTQSVDNERLEKEINHLKTKMIQSRAGKTLIRSAHFCHQMRAAVLKGDDFTTKQWLKRCEKFETIPEIDAEFHLVLEDVENREMVALLKDKLRKGRIKGTFGNIDLGAIDFLNLEAAVKEALKVPETERLREFNEMLFASQAIVRVRRELKAALSSSAKLSEFRHEEDVEAKKLAEIHKSFHDFDALSAEVDEDETIRQLRLDLEEKQKTEEREMRKHLADLIASRKGQKSTLEMENKHCWERLKFTLLEANAALLHEMTRSEVQIAQIAWDEHDINEMFIRSMKRGSGGEGNTPIGSMNMTRIELHNIKDAIKRADKASDLSEETRALRRNAVVILKLREALRAIADGGDWESVRRIVSLYKFSAQEDPSKAMRLPQNVLEIDRAFAEWQYHQVVSALESALNSGSPIGRPGELDYTEVATRELDEAISKAERANVPADRCDELYRKAMHTRRIRRKLMSLRRDERLRVIEMAEDAISRRSETPEILAVLEDQKHLYIVETLSEALRLPGIRGSVETLTVSVSCIEALRDALSHVADIECSTRVCQDTIEAAKYILKLRETVTMEEPDEPYTMSEKWRALHEYVHSKKRKYCGTDSDCLSDDDLPLVANHCLNRLLQASIVKALTTGRARGDPGHLDVDVISTVELDKKIQLAETYLKEEDRMLRTSELLTAAQDIRTLRTMLKAKAYGEVERVLMKLDGERVAPICLEEIHHAHREVEYHIIAEELRDSLKSGGPKGPIGAMQTDDIDLTMLNRAIPHAMDVEFVSENLQRLLMSAVLVKRLRTALKQNRWKVVSQLVKFTERKDFDLDESVKEEVERSRLEVVSRATLAELNIALANKNAAAVRTYLEHAKNSPLRESEVAQKTMDRAQIFLDKLEECKTELAHFAEDENVAYTMPQYLQEVLDEAEFTGYNSPEVQKAIHLQSEIRALTNEARKAIASKNRSQMLEAVRKLTERNVQIPEVAALKELLDMPESVLLQKQLIDAVKNDDEARIASITCRMKAIYFTQHGYEDFALTNFPRLKTPHQFISHEMVHERSMDEFHRWEEVQHVLEAKRDAMLKFSSDRLHTSLTHLPSNIPRAAAVHSFDVFTKYISDIPSRDVEEELAHVLWIGVQNPTLRDEYFIQVIKQMTGNPVTQSIIRAWKLFDLLLLNFPPTEDFENFLEAFIRRRSDADSRLKKLHLILYVGRQHHLQTSETAILKVIQNYKKE